MGGSLAMGITGQNTSLVGLVLLGLPWLPHVGTLVWCTWTLIRVCARESIWNLSFNRPLSIWTPFRVLYLLVWEILLLCERNSVILDSPLSELGHQQSACVLKWLEYDASMSMLEKHDSMESFSNQSLESGEECPVFYWKFYSSPEYLVGTAHIT